MEDWDWMMRRVAGDRKRGLVQSARRSNRRSSHSVICLTAGVSWRGIIYYRIMALHDGNKPCADEEAQATVTEVHGTNAQIPAACIHLHFLSACMADFMALTSLGGQVDGMKDLNDE